MNITQQTIATLFAAAASLPHAALAEMAATHDAFRSPITASCRTSNDFLPHDDDRPADIVAGILWLRLTNTAPIAASEVTLRVRYGGDIETVVESGTFSSGIRVDRKSNAIAYAPWAGTHVDACDVVTVRFVDGNSWASTPRG